MLLCYYRPTIGYDSLFICLGVGVMDLHVGYERASAAELLCVELLKLHIRRLGIRLFIL